MSITRLIVRPICPLPIPLVAIIVAYINRQRTFQFIKLILAKYHCNASKMKSGALSLCFVFMTVTFASGLSYVKYVTYTDSTCTTPNGGFFAFGTENCAADNGFPTCWDLNGGLYVKGDCLDTDPMLDLPSNYVTMYIYPSIDTTCNMKSLSGSYQYAHAAPADVCFYGISSYIYKMTGCTNDSTVTFNYYVQSTNCFSDSPIVQSTLSMPNATCVLNPSDQYDCRAYCPAPLPPVAAPVAPPMTEPGTAPVSGPVSTPLAASGPSSTSTPGQTQAPAKKSSSVARSSAGLIWLVGLTLYALL